MLTTDLKPSPASTIYEDASEHPLETTAALTNDAAKPALTPLTTNEDASRIIIASQSSSTPQDAPEGTQSTRDALHDSPVADVGLNAHGRDTDQALQGNPANNLNNKTQPNDFITLTPLRAHYLKKSLVTLQFSKELLGFTDMDPSIPLLSPLSYLGAPFTPPPRNAPKHDVPFLRFMFRQFVLTFPFIAAAPKDFFPSKVQPFVGSLMARNLSTTDDVLGMDDPNSQGEDPEVRSRQKLLAKSEKYFSLIVGSAIKLTEPEEVVRLSQRDLDRLEMLARRRNARMQHARDAFDVNIICVRSVVEKGRMRSRVHEEFIIRTRRGGWADTLVSRRHGDFKTLAEEVCFHLVNNVLRISLTSCSFARPFQTLRFEDRQPRTARLSRLHHISSPTLSQRPRRLHRFVHTRRLHALIPWPRAQTTCRVEVHARPPRASPRPL